MKLKDIHQNRICVCYETQVFVVKCLILSIIEVLIIVIHAVHER